MNGSYKNCIALQAAWFLWLRSYINSVPCSATLFPKLSFTYIGGTETGYNHLLGCFHNPKHLRRVFISQWWLSKMGKTSVTWSKVGTPIDHDMVIYCDMIRILSWHHWGPSNSLINIHIIYWTLFYMYYIDFYFQPLTSCSFLFLVTPYGQNQQPPVSCGHNFTAPPGYPIQTQAPPTYSQQGGGYWK